MAIYRDVKRPDQSAIKGNYAGILLRKKVQDKLVLIFSCQMVIMI
jgi:hypothetical protein